MLHHRLVRRGLLVWLALNALSAEAACLGSQGVPSGRSRPTIGLALSGGGARGGAHIGVLKALEVLRVPVDCIAGTSIGAVVGGLSATGMTAEQIEKILDEIDWNALFLDETPRRLESFRRKRDDDLFLIHLRPGLKHGQIELPIGVVQGQVADAVLERYTLPAAKIHEFDELPIPFRAVASDFATGQAVVLGSGNLARAIRASMAIPAALTPVVIDNRLLVDGGLAMNLPVQVARQMGADVVIAVNTSTPLRSRESIKNVVDVTGQLTDLLTRQGLEKQLSLLGKEDVLLTPEFPQRLSFLDFEHMADAIDAGYKAAMQHREELERYSLSPEEYSEYLAARHDTTLSRPPVIGFIRIDNKSKIADSVIRARLQGVMLGKPLEFSTIEAAIDRVYGLDLFENVRYRIVTEGDESGVEVEVVPRSWGPNYLQLGMQYSSSEDADALFGLAASYLRTAVDPLGGEWRSIVEIGDQPAITFDAYQPLGPKGLFFIEPTLGLDSKRYDAYQGERLLSQAQLHEATLEVSGGRELMSWGEVRAGVRRGHGDTKLTVGLPELVPAAEYQRGEAFLGFAADTLDAIAFPTRGVLANAEWRASRPGLLGAERRFDQLLLSAIVAKSWGRDALLATARYDTTLSGRAPLNRSFRLGGFLDLSGLNQGQLTGQRVARIGASFYRRVGHLTFLPAFLGVSAEVGKAWGGINAPLDDTQVGGSVWAGIDSPVGPIYVAYGRAEGGTDAFYVFLGRAF